MKVPTPRKLKSGNYFIQLQLGGVSVPVTATTAKECTRQAELIKAEHRSGKRESTALGPALRLDSAISSYIDSRRSVEANPLRWASLRFFYKKAAAAFKVGTLATEKVLSRLHNRLRTFYFACE